MKNLRNYSRNELEILAKEQQKIIAQYKMKSYVVDFVRVVEDKENLMKELAEWKIHAHNLYIRLQQHRLYLGGLDIVEFYKSIEKAPLLHESNKSLMRHHVDNLE